MVEAIAVFLNWTVQFDSMLRTAHLYVPDIEVMRGARPEPDGILRLI